MYVNNDEVNSKGIYKFNNSACLSYNKNYALSIRNVVWRDRKNDYCNES